LVSLNHPPNTAALSYNECITVKYRRPGRPSGADGMRGFTAGHVYQAFTFLMGEKREGEKEK